MKKGMWRILSRELHPTLRKKNLIHLIIFLILAAKVNSQQNQTLTPSPMPPTLQPTYGGIVTSDNSAETVTLVLIISFVFVTVMSLIRGFCRWRRAAQNNQTPHEVVGIEGGTGAQDIAVGVVVLGESLNPVAATVEDDGRDTTASREIPMVDAFPYRQSQVDTDRSTVEAHLVQPLR